MRTVRISRSSHERRRGHGGNVLLIVAPDFARRIDLPGAGPCPRPVDIDRAKTGLKTLVSLRIYSFAEEMVIDGEAEDDEVFIVLLRGQADIAVDSAGKRVGTFSLGTRSGSRAVYLPPHASYQLTAVADCDIAYARAQPTEPAAWPTSFAAVGGRLEVADHAVGMELAFVTLPIGADLALVASDGRSPERFVHLRGDSDGMATVGDATLGNWDSAVLGDGERAVLTVTGGPVDILTISASKH